MNVYLPLGALAHNVAAVKLHSRYAYKPRPSVGISACRRQIAYHAMGTQPDTASGRFATVLRDGHYHESQTFDMLEDAGIVFLSRKRWPDWAGGLTVPVPGHWWRGYCGSPDGIFLHTDGTVGVIEAKSWEMHRFDAVEGLEGDILNDPVEQAACYLAGLRAMAWTRDAHVVVVVVKNKGTGALWHGYWSLDCDGDTLRPVSGGTTRLPDEQADVSMMPTVSLTDVVARRAERDMFVQQHVDAGTLPGRDYVAGHWRCQRPYCPYVTTCMSTWEAETASEETDAPPGEITAALNQLGELRRRRLVSEKLEDTHREIVRKSMEAAGLRRVATDGFVATRELVPAPDKMGDGAQVREKFKVDFPREKRGKHE